jgi:LDH2 family malate/lactate/ureidoglycolate dehydrogenase
MEEKRKRERERGTARIETPGEDKTDRDRKNKEERGLEFPKDLCVISKNCRDLFVKQNFPLI